jgi:hypothetical protein
MGWGLWLQVLRVYKDYMYKIQLWLRDKIMGNKV